MTIRTRFWATALVLTASGCLRFDAYTCEENPQCQRDGNPGVCQISGFCSYPDATCPGTGLRYEGDAGGSLAGQCVSPSLPTSSTESTTSEGGPTSDDSGPDPTSSTTTSAVDPSSSSSGGDACGGPAQACCEGSVCGTGLQCFADQCGCIVALESGDNHECIIKVDGTVWCWGANDQAQVPSSLAANVPTPTRIDNGLDDGVSVVALSARQQTCVVRDDGTGVCWGQNTSGEAVPTDPSPITLPTFADFAGNYATVAAGGNFTCLGHNKTPLATCIGNNARGQLGSAAALAPGPTTIEGLFSFSQLEAGARHACGRTAMGELYCWGDNQQGQLAEDPLALPMSDGLRLVVVPPAADLAVGNEHTCIRADEQVLCWGRNDVGQVGDGSQLQANTPMTVPLPAGPIERLEAGPNHTCAVMTSGELYCWGSNLGDQLRLVPDEVGFNAYSLVPVLVDVAPLNVQNVAGGLGHACVLTREHDVYCWGPNTLGQAGVGDTSYVFDPTVIDLQCP